MSLLAEWPTKEEETNKNRTIFSRDDEVLKFQSKCKRNLLKLQRPLEVALSTAKALNGELPPSTDTINYEPYENYAPLMTTRIECTELILDRSSTPETWSRYADERLRRAVQHAQSGVSPMIDRLPIPAKESGP